jgi:cytochrome c553
MKWIKRIVLGFLAFALLAVAVVWVWGGMIIDKKFSSVERSVLTSSRPEIIERGERLSKVYGCYNGCHAKDMEGEIFFEGLIIGKIIAPNLTSAVDKYTRTELEALVRQGVKPDGTLSAVLSFIENFPKQELDLGPSSFGLLPRFGLIVGMFELAAEEVEHEPWESDVLADPLKLGEYVANNTCSECHGMDFEGQEGFTPSLVIAKGYSLADFKHLMISGEGVGGRDLGLMSEVAIKRYSHLTEHELESLHQFLMER